MIITYFLIIILMRVIQSMFNKRAAITLPDNFYMYIEYLTISKAMAAILSLFALTVMSNFSGINLQGVIIAACAGIFLTVGSFCGIRAMLGGTIVLSSIFTSAGLVVPVIAGIFLFDERISPVQFLGIIALLLSSILLISSSKKLYKKFSPKMLFWLLGSLFSNGAVMLCQKLFGVNVKDGNIYFFSFLMFGVPAVFLAVLYGALRIRNCLDKPKTKKVFLLPKQLYVYAAFLAFAVFVINHFVMLLTPLVSSIILFGIVNGGATIIAAIVGAVFYREKLTPRSILGVLIGVLSLIIIKFL